jgi:hypothetical protein
MSQNETVPELPEIFRSLDSRFSFSYLGQDSPLVGRPWRADCRACAKPFYPLATSGAVANMGQHVCEKPPLHFPSVQIVR